MLDKLGWDGSEEGTLISAERCTSKLILGKQHKQLRLKTFKSQVNASSSWGSDNVED